MLFCPELNGVGWKVCPGMRVGLSSRLDWAVVDRAAIVMATADRARARLDLPMMMHHGFLPRNCRLC